MFTGFAQPPHPAIRYGILVVLVGLLAWEIQSYRTLPPGYPYDPYSNIIVVIMLLFNHLAYMLEWHRHVAVVLRVLSLGWLVFGLFYIFYLSKVLYPLPTLS